jgi:glutaredoxin
MIIIYGADWCEDTRRSLRLLRRLGAAHRYINIDDDIEALERAKALNDGVRRTPVVDLGTGGGALVEPENETLTAALVELEMLTREDVMERQAVQNVGDTERIIRVGIGLASLLAGIAAPRVLRLPLRLTGAYAALTGILGWCPGYHAAGVTSLAGPGDHPEEAERTSWLAAR